MKSIFDQIFKSTNGGEYGIIREVKPPYPIGLSGSKVLSEDECGDFLIVVEGKISFWNHEKGGVGF